MIPILPRPERSRDRWSLEVSSRGRSWQWCRLALLAIFSAGCSLANSFEAATQFSFLQNNAQDTWSYWGATSTSIPAYTSSISLLPTSSGNCGAGTTCWSAAPVSGGPDIMLDNVTGTDVLLSNADLRNNQITLVDRTGILLVRFLVPAAATYSIAGLFEGNSTNPPGLQPSSTEVIDVDGNIASALLDETVTLGFGSLNQFSYSNVTLNAGDTVDFLVSGTATNGSRSLASGFDATITQTGSQGTVPEPGTFLLFASGLVALGAFGALTIVRRGRS